MIDLLIGLVLGTMLGIVMAALVMCILVGGTRRSIPSNKSLEDE